MFGKLVIDCEENKLNFKLIAKAVYKELKQKAKLKAELIFVSEEEIKEINAKERNIDAVTDVLSFPTLDDIKGEILKSKDFPYDTENGFINIGSIAICEKRCAEQAVEYGHSTEREMTYLLIHGLLHLMGYDHIDEQDKIEMRTKEKAVLKRLKLGE